MYAFSYAKGIVGLVTIFLLSIFLCRQVYAVNYIINEDFNGDFSEEQLWKVTKNGGNVNFTDNPGSITLKTSTSSFPFVSSNEFNIENNFELDFTFKYIGPRFDFGAGIAITEAQYGIDEVISEKVLFGIWQDQAGKLRLSTRLCSIDNESCEAYTILQTSVLDTDLHNIVIKYYSGIYTLIYDGQEVFKSFETLTKPNRIWFGNPNYPYQNGGWANFRIDHIRITDLSDNRLGVPQYFQNDEQWKDDEYDSALSWKAEYPYMKNLGCAVTSATMQLRHKGVDKLPSGEELTPQTLNNYLTSEPRGYLGHGSTNWLKIAAMTKESNDLYGTPKMEWMNKVRVMNFQDYEDNHVNDQSEILILKDYWWNNSTHFFVGTGFDDNNILINDPLNKYDVLERDLNIKRRGYFYETNSDFSGMAFVSTDKIDMVLISPDGNKIGFDGQSAFDEIETGSYSIDSITFFSEDETVEVDESFNTELMLSHLVAGEYRLLVSASESASFSIDPFVQNSDAKNILFEDLEYEINPGETVEYLINFTNDDQTTIELVEQDEPVTFDFLRQTIKDGYDDGLIKSRFLKNDLLLKLRLAEFMYDHGRDRVAGIMLDYMQRVIDGVSQRYLDAEFGDELSEIIDELEVNLEL